MYEPWWMGKLSYLQMAVAALPTSGAGAGVAVSSVAVSDAGALVLTQSHRLEEEKYFIVF